MSGGIDEYLEGIEACEVGLVGGWVGVGDVARDGDLEVVDEGLDVMVAFGWAVGTTACGG